MEPKSPLPPPTTHRMPRQTQRLTDRKRHAVINAAIEEFIEAGFEATSMDRIAARADVSKRTVYNHFPSKEALFAEILQQLWDASSPDRSSSALEEGRAASAEGGALVSPLYQPDAPLRPQLLALLRRKLRLMDGDAFLALARVAIAAGMHSPERARDMVARLGEREEDLTVWISAAARDGRLSLEDPMFASQELQSVVKGFAFWPQIALGQARLSDDMQKRVADSAADMFLARYARRESDGAS